MTAPTLENWTPEQTQAALLANEIILIDVRNPEEYAIERVGGAMLFPLSDFTPSILPNDPHKRIVLTCAGGVRSAKAADLCLQQGFEQIAHLAGGMKAWKESGLPYIGTDAATGASHHISG